MRATLSKMPNTLRFVPVGDQFIPELELYVNPESFAKTYQQIVTKLQTRGGFVLQHWGEQLSSIEASGKSGVFFTAQREVLDTGVELFRQGSQNEPPKLPSNSAGIQSSSEEYGLANIAVEHTPDRKTTKAWISFHKFIDMYRKSTLLQLFYDGRIYSGFLTNFSWGEDAMNPFLITYSFSYTVLNEEREQSRG